MADKTLGEQLMDSLTRYTHDKENEIAKAAAEIQKEMLNEITSTSPVLQYNHNGGVRRRNVSRRQKNSPTKWGSWGERFQPGRVRTGWVKSTFKPKAENKEKIYAVRNKNTPQLIHLLNFDHDHKSHGEETGRVVHGTQFVTKVQDKGIEKFGKEIEDILKK